jgi:hypothetical protein
MRRLSPSVLVREELDRLLTDGVGREENIVTSPGKASSSTGR